jgi:alpha-tubulin suppressor-like RCC1 family protein
VEGLPQAKSISVGGYDRLDVGLALGLGLSCAVSAVNAAFCWGFNETGAVGDGTRVDRNLPTPVVGGHSFKSVAAGATHACGLTSAAEIWCWGSNSVGQLGVVLSGANPDNLCFAGDTAAPCSTTPVQVDANVGFQAVAAAPFHTCAIDLYGAAWCWGRNFAGQVGIGEVVTDVLTPARVVGGRTYLKLDGLLTTTCGLTSHRDAFCWGAGSLAPHLVPAWSGPPTSS